MFEKPKKPTRDGSGTEFFGGGRAEKIVLAVRAQNTAVLGPRALPVRYQCVTSALPVRYPMRYPVRYPRKPIFLRENVIFVISTEKTGTWGVEN